MAILSHTRCQIFKLYLTNIQFLLKYQDSITLRLMNSGTIQESIMGPTLYSLNGDIAPQEEEVFTLDKI